MRSSYAQALIPEGSEFIWAGLLVAILWFAAVTALLVWLAAMVAKWFGWSLPGAAGRALRALGTRKVLTLIGGAACVLIAGAAVTVPVAW
ncbi:hypothetical protein [Candidatus Poriferisodalis sp.]|uniref:hypothetical protein n=1 Tax=Candidatus Poriferisodalis sp. TaxID=3101277 RepID=UPI003B0181B2